MKGPKPIVVVTTPPLGKFSRDRLRYLFKPLKDEYHAFILEANVMAPKVEVFYEKDFNKIKYEELKKLIQDNTHNTTV